MTPDDTAARFAEALALQQAGRLEEAEFLYRAVLDAEPDLPEAHNNLGVVLQEMDRPAEAEACYRKGLALKPSLVDTYNNLGVALLNLGRFDEAAAMHETALARGADPCLSWYGLSACRKFTVADRAAVAAMMALLDRQDLSDAGRSMLHFALGKVSDDLGEYEGAIRHFDMGNRLERAGREFDDTGLARAVDSLIAAFPDPPAPSAAASDSEKPVLIVGMPRSGTTLTEQILASHPSAAGGGELTFWFRWLNAMKGVPAGLTDEAAMVADYLDRLARISPSALRVTDKMPFNFLLLGLVLRLFPNARIVHCRRDPVDTALSIYFTRFKAGTAFHEFAYSRADIVSYYRQYLRLMAHWRGMLPADRLLEIDYETLVADREAVSRKLVAFCGLDWDDACLDFHKTERPVGTASSWQVRQPAYRGSVSRARNYEPWLGELALLRGQGPASP